MPTLILIIVIAWIVFVVVMEIRNSKAKKNELDYEMYPIEKVSEMYRTEDE